MRVNKMFRWIWGGKCGQLWLLGCSFDAAVCAFGFEINCRDMAAAVRIGPCECGVVFYPGGVR